MSKADEFIEQYYNEYGCIPDADTIRQFMDKDECESDYRKQEYRPHFNNGYDDSHYTNAEPACSELIEEVKDIFSNIAHVAKVAVSKSSENEAAEEFLYMAAAFLLKSSLYFLLKRSSELGYDSVSSI